MRRFCAGRWAALAVLAAAACGPAGLNLGPIPVDFPIGSGAIDPDSLISIPGFDLSRTARQDFCALPTEEDIVDRLPEIAGIDMDRFVKLTAIELTGIVVTAESGDFSFLREITVSFVPKPVDGEEREPVVIGYAYSENGFGASVVLYPPDEVDLLELIRDNDDNPASECPQIEITVTGSRPGTVVQWQGFLQADIYARLGA